MLSKLLLKSSEELALTGSIRLGSCFPIASRPMGLVIVGRWTAGLVAIVGEDCESGFGDGVESCAGVWVAVFFSFKILWLVNNSEYHTSNNILKLKKTATHTPAQDSTPSPKPLS
ncbi:MAG: hypothetical protein AAF431_06700, partial [Pseudomonadota bacterium]